jgi:hypothetical protein
VFHVKQIPAGLSWLQELGLTELDREQLNPCIPGEFTMPGTIYVNTATPRVVYRGTEEGTLPMVSGRWYLVPASLVRAHPILARDAAPVARAARLAR